MKNKMNMVISIIIFIVVIAGLVYITINRKNNSMNQQQPVQQNPTAEQGLNVTILKEGTGEVAVAGETVSVNYTGTLVDGTVFDSNTDPKFQHVTPFEFSLGAGQVIPGWDKGVAGMKIGEIRKLEIAPELAYGATGAGNGIIPPNAILTFTVELLGIKK